MGLLGRLSVLRSPAFRPWRALPERWARVLGIQRFGPIARVQLEVHVAELPVHEVMTTSRIPRGIEPEVGQHVALHLHDNGRGSAPSYIIDWRREPRYGAAKYDPADRVASHPQPRDRRDPTHAIRRRQRSADPVR